MIEPGQHIAVFGLSGCGKTTLTRLISDCFQRKIIFDRLGEWSGESDGEVGSFEDFAKEYERLYPESHFTLVFRPKAGLGSDDLVATTDRILNLIYQAESHGAQGIALIFEEVWLYAPLMQTPPWFLETVLTGRHHKISIIGNSQRPATVTRTFTSQCRHVFIGQFFEGVDKKYFRDYLGFEPKSPEKFHFLWHRPGSDIQTVSVNRPAA